MKYDGELARDRHDRLLHAPALRYAHAPGLECTPATAGSSQQHKRGLVEGGSHYSVPAFRHAPDPRCLTGLVKPRREPVMCSDTLGSAEPSRVINTGAVRERHPGPTPGAVIRRRHTGS